MKNIKVKQFVITLFPGDKLEDKLDIYYSLNYRFLQIISQKKRFNFYLFPLFYRTTEYTILFESDF